LIVQSIWTNSLVYADASKIKKCRSLVPGGLALIFGGMILFNR
jgi:hypothetical protein